MFNKLLEESNWALLRIVRGGPHLWSKRTTTACLSISGLGITLVKFDTVTVRLDAKVTKCKLVVLISTSHTHVHLGIILCAEGSLVSKNPGHCSPRVFLFCPRRVFLQHKLCFLFLFFLVVFKLLNLSKLDISNYAIAFVMVFGEVSVKATLKGHYS